MFRSVHCELRGSPWLHSFRFTVCKSANPPALRETCSQEPPSPTQAAAPAEARSFPDPVRSFLCPQTMLLRHPHAAPSNALQRKMAEEKEPASETARRGQLRSAAESEEAGTSGWRLADWQTGLPEEPPSPVPSPHHCNRRTQGQTPRASAVWLTLESNRKALTPCVRCGWPAFVLVLHALASHLPIFLIRLFTGFL